MGILNNDRARGRMARRVALSLTTILAAGFATPAMAQEAPLHRNYDANGVDQVDGSFRFSVTEGVIGSGAGALSVVRYRFSGGPRDNWSGELRKTVSGGVTTITLNLGDLSEKFTLTGGTYVSVKGNGSTLVENTTDMEFTYTASNGTRIVYQSPLQLATVPLGATATIDMPSGYCTASNAVACGVPTSVKQPNQLEATLTWNVPVYCSEEAPGGEVGGGGPGDPPNECRIWYRLQDIRNNAGYAIKVKWKANSLVSGNPPSNWFWRDSLRFMDLGQVYCDPNATNCDSVAGIAVTYTTPSGGVEEFTDWQGGTWRFTLSTPYGVRRPGSSADDITASSSSGKVSSVTKDGLTTNYSWSTNTVTTTNPSSNTNVVVSDPTAGQPTSSTNGTGDTVTRTYDSNGRLTRETMPLGNYVNYTYDSRGNVTEVRHVAHAISGVTTPADIVTTAYYPSTCSNPLTCNLPEYTIDERGNRTDYTYDTAHGGVTRVQYVAPTGSTRPEVNISYTSIYAKERNSSGVLVDAATPTYLPSQIKVCATAATCSASANETVTSYSYGSGGTIDNLLPLTVTIAAGDGSISATTTYTYNDAGQVLTADGPLSGTADTTRYRYGSDGRLVGIVSPDPDGGGALKHRAVRYTYTDGLLTTTEVGTVNSQSDGDWASMTVLQTATTTYDTDNRVVKRVVSAGGTSYAVTQYSYNANKQLECVAVRMNPAEFASLPSSACTLDTAGSFGQDRITKYTYDAAGRQTVVQTGYGVSGVQASEVTAAYTTNGRVQSATDAEGNKTTYVYEGHDRLWKTVFPDATKGSGSSNSGDYVELVYDPASNVTSRRLRDGTSIAYTYDNANQLTAKNLPGSEPDVTYSYDLTGRPTGAASSIATLTFGYDALGRNTSQGGPLGTVGYQYDLAGRRTRLTWPDAFYVDYDHLVTGEVTAIRENGATSGLGVLATYAYDDLGRRASRTFGNGTVTTYGFDSVSRLTSLSLNLDGGTTTNDVTTSFSYSPAGGIASQTRTNDLYAWGGHYNVARGYTSNGLNQLTSSGGPSLSYDARGNLTGSGSDSFGYSSENLLTSATVASASSSYEYDPLLRMFRINASPNLRYLYDGGESIGSYDSSGALVRRFVFGPETDEVLVEYTSPTTPVFLHADERGSIVARSNRFGTKTQISSYDEYGVPVNTGAGRHQYTGQAWIPSLGMYYYKARIYSPTLGRFLQSDPIGYGDGMNFNAYVGNDPINFIDPSGLQSWNDCILDQINNLQNGGAQEIVLCGSDRDPPAGNVIVIRVTPVGGRPGTPGGPHTQIVVRTPKVPDYCHSTPYLISNMISEAGKLGTKVSGVLVAAGLVQIGISPLTAGSTAVSGGATLEMGVNGVAAFGALQLVGDYGKAFSSNSSDFASMDVATSTLTFGAALPKNAVGALGAAIINNIVRNPVKDPCNG